MRDPLCDRLDQLVEHFSRVAMNYECPPLGEPCGHVGQPIDLAELFGDDPGAGASPPRGVQSTPI
jgi:hypothetical protein